MSVPGHVHAPWHGCPQLQPSSAAPYIRDQRQSALLQEVYEGVPIALAPVLGNPLSLAAAGIDRSAPLQTQVGCSGASSAVSFHHAVAVCACFEALTCSYRLICVGTDLQAAAFGQGLANLIPQLSALTDILPPPTLAWKLRMLAAGCKFVENK